MVYTRDQIIEKVRNILSRAENTTYEGEANTALAMAQKFMVQHNLSMTEVERDTRKRVEHHQADVMPHRILWRGWLSAVVGLNFRCIPYYQTTRRGGKVVVQLVFIGFPDDVAVAIEAYQTACRAAEHLARRHLEQRKREADPTGEFERMRQAVPKHLRRGRMWARICPIPVSQAMKIKRSFIEGFVIGLERHLDEQRRVMMEADPGTTALVLVVPQEVQEEADATITGKTGKSRGSAATDSEAYYAGQEEGSQFDPTTRRIRK